MPLLVRGPGVAVGSATSRLALNTDYMPTFTDLACSSVSPCDTQNWSYVPDGRTLEPEFTKAEFDVMRARSQQAWDAEAAAG